MSITASTAIFASKQLYTDLDILCVQDSCQKYKQHASRMTQQLEPIWEAAWGNRADGRPVRTVFLSSREPSSAELNQHMSASSFPVLMISWKDYFDSARGGSLDDYRVLILKIESLAGRMPIVLVHGHSESRGGKDVCSQDFLDNARAQPGTMRLIKSQILTLDMRLNKAQQNLFFDSFAESAAQDTVHPVSAESITVLSEDEASAQNFHRCIAPIQSAAMGQKPVNHLHIMSRDDEFSVNPRSLYIVVVKAEENTLASDDEDGDYRMVLHRILFHTGRIPIVAISGDTSAEGLSALLSPRFQRIARLPALARCMTYAVAFNRSLSPAQLTWLASVIEANVAQPAAAASSIPPTIPRPSLGPASDGVPVAVHPEVSSSSVDGYGSGYGSRSSGYGSQRAESPAERQLEAARQQIYSVQLNSTKTGGKPSKIPHQDPPRPAPTPPPIPRSPPATHVGDSESRVSSPPRSSREGSPFTHSPPLHTASPESYTAQLLSRERSPASPPSTGAEEGPGGAENGDKATLQPSPEPSPLSPSHSGPPVGLGAGAGREEPVVEDAWSRLERLRETHAKALEEERARLARAQAELAEQSRLAERRRREEEAREERERVEREREEREREEREAREREARERAERERREEEARREAERREEARVRRERDEVERAARERAAAEERAARERAAAEERARAEEEERKRREHEAREKEERERAERERKDREQAAAEERRVQLEVAQKREREEAEWARVQREKTEALQAEERALRAQMASRPEEPPPPPPQETPPAVPPRVVRAGSASSQPNGARLEGKEVPASPLGGATSAPRVLWTGPSAPASPQHGVPREPGPPGLGRESSEGGVKVLQVRPRQPDPPPPSSALPSAAAPASREGPGGPGGGKPMGLVAKLKLQAEARDGVDGSKFAGGAAAHSAAPSSHPLPAAPAPRPPKQNQQHQHQHQPAVAVRGPVNTALSPPPQRHPPPHIRLSGPAPPATPEAPREGKPERDGSVLVGVGMGLGVDGAGSLVVSSVEQGSNAARAGIVAGSVLCTVDGNGVQGKPLEQVRALLVGEPHTAVVLGLRAPLASDVQDFAVIRQASHGSGRKPHPAQPSTKQAPPPQHPAHVHAAAPPQRGQPAASGGQALPDAGQGGHLHLMQQQAGTAGEQAELAERLEQPGGDGLLWESLREAVSVNAEVADTQQPPPQPQPQHYTPQQMAYMAQPQVAMVAVPGYYQPNVPPGQQVQQGAQAQAAGYVVRAAHGPYVHGGTVPQQQQQQQLAQVQQQQKQQQQHQQHQHHAQKQQQQQQLAQLEAQKQQHALAQQHKALQQQQQQQHIMVQQQQQQQQMLVQQQQRAQYQQQATPDKQQQYQLWYQQQQQYAAQQQQRMQHYYAQQQAQRRHGGGVAEGGSEEEPFVDVPEV